MSELICKLWIVKILAPIQLSEEKQKSIAQLCQKESEVKNENSICSI